MAQLNRELWKLVILGLLGALAVMGISYYVSRRISTRVSHLADVADKMAAGDIDQMIVVDSKDEVGLLAKAFGNLAAYMNEMAAAAQSIANNDLTVQVHPRSEKDVLGIAVQTMVESLVGMIRRLKDNAIKLTSAATEISASADQMSKGARDQADRIVQVSTAIEEMSATIIESSRNAGEASEMSKNASDTASTGGQIVYDTIQGMQTINKVVRGSAESIAALAKSADRIGEIIGVIDDIADQTNLLALNAAIEAARAGEQGRGFAVVADEVRKLAERTGSATGEITAMIKGIQNDTEGAVNSMEAGIQEIDKGRELADKAGDSLKEIVAVSERVMDMIRQIATAVEEQSTTAEEITRSIEGISSVTKETATGAEQSASASEELSRQAETLMEMVGTFRLNE